MLCAAELTSSCPTLLLAPQVYKAHQGRASQQQHLAASAAAKLPVHNSNLGLDQTQSVEPSASYIRPHPASPGAGFGRITRNSGGHQSQSAANAAAPSPQSLQPVSQASSAAGTTTQLSALVPPAAPPQSRPKYAVISYKQWQAAQAPHPGVCTQPPKTHAELVEQVHQALHRVLQARTAFHEAMQKFEQHFTTIVQLRVLPRCGMMLQVQQSLEVILSLAYMLLTLPVLPVLTIQSS